STTGSGARRYAGRPRASWRRATGSSGSARPGRGWPRARGSSSRPGSPRGCRACGPTCSSPPASSRSTVRAAAPLFARSTRAAAAGEARPVEGTAPALPVGSYVVRLDVPQLASALEIDSPSATPSAALEVTARETPERVELAARRDTLDRLASATGGKVLAD